MAGLGDGTVRLMTQDERRERGAFAGCEAYVVNVQLDHGLSEDIILIRAYDIWTDTFPCRAFSPQQWREAQERMRKPIADRRALPPDGPSVGCDVPGGGACD